MPCRNNTNAMAGLYDSWRIWIDKLLNNIGVGSWQNVVRWVVYVFCVKRASELSRLTWASWKWTWPLAFTLQTHHKWLVLVLIMNGKGFLQRLEGKKSPLPFVWILLLDWKELEWLYCKERLCIDCVDKDTRSRIELKCVLGLSNHWHGWWSCGSVHRLREF